MKHETIALGRAVYHAFPYIAGYAGQKDGAAIITCLMDTIQKTATQIIEVVETRLLGEHTESPETDEAPPIPGVITADRARPRA